MTATDSRYDRWLDDRAMYFADGHAEDPAPDAEPDALEEYRADCSRALNELADALRAEERRSRELRDHSAANACRNRAEAYQHAAAIVARFRS